MFVGVHVVWLGIASVMPDLEWNGSVSATRESASEGRFSDAETARANDTVYPPLPITVNTPGGILTRPCTPTIGIPFTRPERERRLDTSATSTDQ
jgi:hypothetical protein